MEARPAEFGVGASFKALAGAGGPGFCLGLIMFFSSC
jgi:hypothetical protein